MDVDNELRTKKTNYNGETNQTVSDDGVDSGDKVVKSAGKTCKKGCAVHKKGNTDSKQSERIAVDMKVIEGNGCEASKPGHVCSGREPAGKAKEAAKGSEKKMGQSAENKTRLMAMFTLTFGFFLVELIVGYMTNSMALVADSFHMLSDVAALVVAFVSVKISPKKWSKNTFGWARAEVLGALINAVFLVALCFSILVESVKRFIHEEEIEQPELILWVGVAGLVVNLIGLCLFRHHHGGHNHHHHSIKHQRDLTRMVATDDNENDERVTSADNAPPQPTQQKSKSASQMNMRGVFLHIMADALGSVIVIISALIIIQTDWSYKMYVDPLLSVILVILILSSVWPLFQESAMILLQTVPTHIQIDELQRKLIKKVEGVIAVHEFHIWQLAGDRIIASAHIRCRNLTDYIRIAEKVKEFFHNEGIHSTTIQPEFVEQFPDVDQSRVYDCYLSCSDPASASSCAANTCCGPISDTDGLESVQAGGMDGVGVNMPV